MPTGKCIECRAEFYRKNGQWYIRLRPPNWLIIDIVAELNAKGGGFALARRDSASMLLVAASRPVRPHEQSEASEEETTDAD